MAGSDALRFVVFVLGALAAVGCGDDDGGDDPSRAGTGGGTRDGGPGGGGDARAGSGSGAGGGTLTAAVDGTRWEATAMIRARTDEDLPGGFVLEGTAINLTHLMLDLYYVDGTGTYSFGVGASVVGARGSYSRPTSIWQTPGNGDAGTLTITTLTAQRIAGMFEFDVVPVPGSAATGMHSVTDGEFDLELEGEATPIAPDIGRQLSAQFNGVRFNAASVVVTPVADGISFNALNDAYNVGFMFAEVDGPGSYALSPSSPLRAVIVVASTPRDTTHCCWGTLLDDDTGSLTLTTFSPDRLAGSFEFTLQPQSTSAASEPLIVTGGSFDIGRADP